MSKAAGARDCSYEKGIQQGDRMFSYVSAYNKKKRVYDGGFMRY